jgi:hypothetical protein
MSPRQAKKHALRFDVPVLSAFERAAKTGLLRMYTREGLEFALNGAEGTLADMKRKAAAGQQLSLKEKRLQGRLTRIKGQISAVLAEGPMG